MLKIRVIRDVLSRLRYHKDGLARCIDRHTSAGSRFMLKIRVIRDVLSRLRYHKDGLALNAAEKFGRWIGSSPHAAGFVTAGIPAEDLAAALSGYTAEGVYMGQRRSSRRRAGWDVVFSPHKSISVAALCLAAPIRAAVRRAWEDAITATVTAMESLACTTNGKGGTIPSGNLLVAAFTHERSRRDDPHLHTHCLVINATRAGAGWRSVEPVPFFRHNLLLDAVLQRELARNLRAAGFAIATDAKGRVSLLGFPDALLAGLSQAKQALDAADAARSYGSLSTLHDTNARRNFLNDRLRPTKRPPTRALPDLIDKPTRRILSQRLRPLHATPRPLGPPVPPQILASQLVTPIYRRSSLWPSTKRLFRSLLEASRLDAETPFSAFLRAIPFVEPPRPHPLTIAALAAAADRVRLTLARAVTRHQLSARRRLLEHPRQLANALRRLALRQQSRSRTLLQQRLRSQRPLLSSTTGRIIAATQRARTISLLLRGRAAAAISRAAAQQRSAALASAARKLRTGTPPAAPQQRPTL